MIENLVFCVEITSHKLKNGHFSNFRYSGFCFLEYESHKAASLAKRRLETGRIKVWSCDIIVDWADPQEEPDEETMSQVSLLFPNVKYLVFNSREKKNIAVKS